MRTRVAATGHTLLRRPRCQFRIWTKTLREKKPKNADLRAPDTATMPLVPRVAALKELLEPEAVFGRVGLRDRMQRRLWLLAQGLEVVHQPIGRRHRVSSVHLSQTPCGELPRALDCYAGQRTTRHTLKLSRSDTKTLRRLLAKKRDVRGRWHGDMQQYVFGKLRASVQLDAGFLFFLRRSGFSHPLPELGDRAKSRASRRPSGSAKSECATCSKRLARARPSPTPFWCR
jgi:hypothetical protein